MYLNSCHVILSLYNFEYSVSPSIYVAFESIHASDLCGDVGPQYPATTLAFAPGELSTSKAYHVLSSLPWNVLLNEHLHLEWTRATFGDQYATPHH